MQMLDDEVSIASEISLLTQTVKKWEKSRMPTIDGLSGSPSSH
jgi:hypothetical protein